MERVVCCRRRFAANLAAILCVLLATSAFGADPSILPRFPLSTRGVILADELSRQWTRDARQLVAVLEQAVDEDPHSPPLTFLLAVAHAETNGKILIVSEAGAVGLAQATPGAYLREGGRGKLFVTPEYVAGAAAYILKKPLGDADTIASLAIDYYDDLAFAEARTLLHAAFKFRREGIDELLLLEPYAGGSFAEELRERDLYNLAVLRELETLLDGCASPLELIAFQVRIHEEYETLKRLQRFYWKRYQADLVMARDQVLRRAFHAEPKAVLERFAYEAAELVARELDDRFSPRSMARFLRDHVVTKMDQAYELGIPEQELERVTAGLYNGGSHNLLRMRTGLIRSLPETDNYMRKVPAMRARLDDALAAALPEGDAGTR
jgi:hypothetical protein